MTTKNPNYELSAVNLCNPREVAALLSQLQEDNKLLTSLKSQLMELQLYRDSKEVEARIAEQIEIIRTAIETYGSFQDTVQGRYAIKQRKVSYSYNAAKFKLRFPAYAPATIIEAVDTVKLGGLLKGGLITMDEMKDASIVAEKTSFSYIIRADSSTPVTEVKTEGY